MKISALEEFGLRCLLHVANADGPVTSHAISESEGISIPYVQKLLRVLINANLVLAQRGVNGGFRLARPVKSISVGEVMRAFGTDDTVDTMCEKSKGSFSECCHSTRCTLKPVWIHIMKLVVHTLDNLPLSILLDSPEKVKDELESIVALPTQTFCPIGALSAPESSNLGS